MQHHCTITGVMAEGIGLLIVLLGNAMCVEGMTMKQETVDPVCQSQAGRTRIVPLYRETRSVPGVKYGLLHHKLWQKIFSHALRVTNSF